jgi:hypothetical protein
VTESVTASEPESVTVSDPESVTVSASESVSETVPAERLTLITSLRAVVERIRRRSPRLARQIEDAASSIAANPSGKATAGRGEIAGSSS